MEKKTIGKFIAVLRKANGMTQKELGERLFVSDKTISRWECDECTPELSLIPVIAEIFGITADELLRGERAAPPSGDIETEKGRAASQKGDKQFRFMLHNRMKKYRILSLISIGIAILGLIAAAVANLAFSEGLIGFCLAAVCVVAAAICQIIFASNAYLLVEEEDTHEKEIKEANSTVTMQAVRVFFGLLAELAFCLPIVLLTYGGVNYGLMFESWLPNGFLCVLILLFLCHFTYLLRVKKFLVSRGLLYIGDDEKEKDAACGRLFKRMLALCLSILAVIGAVAFAFGLVGAEPFIEKKVFTDPEEFKTYMEAEYDEWVEHGYYYRDEGGDVVLLPPAKGEDEFDKYYKETGVVRDENGNVILTFYYHSSLYHLISFSENEQMPVTVITREARGNGYDTFNTVMSVLSFFAVSDVVACAVVYLVRRHRIYKK
ncbi:MAG: helix-turn-helix transcriptional regulator [Clostridia bacterium]|nr:helix-turn-helix transcriptional regulator [Clostridia bacterium]